MSGMFHYEADEPEAFDIVSRFVLGDASREEFAYELAGLWLHFDGPFLRMVQHAAIVFPGDGDPDVLRRDLSACMRAEPVPVRGVFGRVASHPQEERTGAGSSSHECVTIHVRV